MIRASLLKILVLTSLGLAMLGCQEGVKKTEETRVHETGVAQVDTLQAQVFEEMGIDLGAQVGIRTADEVPEFPQSLNESEMLPRLQSLLEQYVFKAQKLLALGDTKVVIFPEKSRIQASVNRASQFLGRVYAAQRISGSTTIEDRTVAYAEMNVRFKRFSAMLTTFDKAGITPAVLEKGQQFKVIAEMSQESMQECVKSFNRATEDAVRMRELALKYNGFDIYGFDKASVQFMQIAGVYQDITSRLKERLNP